MSECGPIKANQLREKNKEQKSETLIHIRYSIGGGDGGDIATLICPDLPQLHKATRHVLTLVEFESDSRSNFFSMVAHFLAAFLQQMSNLQNWVSIVFTAVAADDDDDGGDGDS